MAVSWVLAADGGYAKILQADNRAAPLVLLEELEHPEARKKNNDFYTDSAGRSFDSGGQGVMLWNPSLMQKASKHSVLQRICVQNYVRLRCRTGSRNFMWWRLPHFLAC